MKIYIRNKFRIRNLITGKIEKLASDIDKNGKDIWVEGFNSHAEATLEMNRWLMFRPQYRGKMVVESYPDKSNTTQTAIDNPRVNRKLEKLRVFSGAGLKHNSSIKKRDENRYSSDKYYDRDTWMAQSVERAKGHNLIRKQGKAYFNHGERASDIPESSGGYIVDTVTQDKVDKLKDHSGLNLSYCVVDNIRKQLHKFNNRKEIKVWLKKRGYSASAQRRICSQVFESK